MTIGAAFSIKDVTLDTGESCRMQLWDFAGEERFQFILADYCRGAAGAMICFDITDYDTFRELPTWLKLIRQGAGNIPTVLVGTKWDLPNHEVELEVAEKYAVDAKCEAGAVFCSSKDSINVEETFHALAKWMIYRAMNS
jgi:Ras-related protein Rab-1A